MILLIFSHPGECQMYAEERDMTKASRHTFGYSSPSATCSLLGIQQLEFILGINHMQICLDCHILEDLFMFMQRAKVIPVKLH